MTKVQDLIALLLLLCTFFSPTMSLASAAPSGGRFGFWCTDTPFPEQCNYFMVNHTKLNNFIPKHKSDFRKVAIQVAMDQALTAHSHHKWLETKSRNDNEKAAWADCLTLYESTIALLNRTVDPTVKSTDFDVQTWLSSALTNLETCRTSFVELGVDDLVLENNVSKHISNSLALGNASMVPETAAYKGGFPRWLSRGDRKLLQSLSPAPNVVVAQDGSGNFTTIQAALDAADKRNGTERYVIRVKSGMYNEYLNITMQNIMLIGDGSRSTIITGNRSVGGGGGYSTFTSSTVGVTGEGFIARGITFRNTAGPENKQAVALRSSSDFSVFYRCSFQGYQDTLYVHSQRQFYRECSIYGTVDFIFGNAAAVLQNCIIYARRPMDHQQVVITAQGRISSDQITGIVIHNSIVTAAPDLKPVVSQFKTFLGRPWQEYSRTVYTQTYLDSLVDPAGWLEWNDTDFALKTLYYGEYKNYGPAASTAGRVKWDGYKVITSADEAYKFTVGYFLGASWWLPETTVPFTYGLL